MTFNKFQVQQTKPVGRIGKSASTEQEQTAQAEFSLKVDRVDHLGNGSAPEVRANHTVDFSSEVLSDAKANKDIEISNVTSSGVPETVEVENNIIEVKEASTTENSVEITYSTANETALVANLEDIPEGTSSSLLKGEGPQNINGNHPAEAVFKGSAADMGTLLAINEASRAHETAQKKDINNGQESELFPEISANTNRQVENKTDSSSMKVQEQIDEVICFLMSKGFHK